MNTLAVASAGHSSAARGPWIDVRPGGPLDATSREVAAEDVRDLIDAAGPLTLRDIAGGLDVPLRLAAERVRRMVAGRTLTRDEFGRYRLWGACAATR